MFCEKKDKSGYKDDLSTKSKHKLAAPAALRGPAAAAAAALSHKLQALGPEVEAARDRRLLVVELRHGVAAGEEPGLRRRIKCSFLKMNDLY